MVRRKRDCPKFRLRWKGPFTVVRRLSDLNYLVRVARNKEIVVNVNKMKRCRQETPPLPSATKSSSLRESEGNEEEGEPNEIHVNLPTPYSYVADSNNEVPIPLPMENPLECEGKTQGSTQETRAADVDRESRTRYWLRRKPTDILTAPDDADSEVVREPTDNEATETDPLTHPIDEVGQEPIPNEGNQNLRYHLRPLPGRKLDSF
jgi:hypothetical protein